MMIFFFLLLFFGLGGWGCLRLSLRTHHLCRAHHFRFFLFVVMVTVVTIRIFVMVMVMIILFLFFLFLLFFLFMCLIVEGIFLSLIPWVNLLRHMLWLLWLLWLGLRLWFMRIDVTSNDTASSRSCFVASHKCQGAAD